MEQRAQARYDNVIRCAQTMNRIDSADVTARLVELAAKAPASPAILAPGGEPLSFGALAGHMQRTAAQLTGWGIERGDIVVWANGDRVGTAVALAVLPASSTIALLSPAATFEAQCDILARLRPKAVIVPVGDDSAITRATRHLGLTEMAAPRTRSAAGSFDLEIVRPTASLDDARRVDPGWACIGGTSGATGRPKIVSHGHRQILATALATGERLEIGPGDVSGHLSPLHLAGGIRNAYFQALLNGAAVNVLPEADAEAFIRAVAAGEATWTSASFTILRELLARIEDGRCFERGRLRYVRVASGRLEADEMDRLERALGVPVITGLASSETGTIAQQPLGAPRQRGSVGPPVATEIRLVDATGRSVRRGEIGEIQVRGPQLFDGYFDDADLDRTSFVDGWFRVGDLGRFDDAGELHLVGRVKEVINRGGDKISPLEVDAVLRAIPGIADAAAFGVPHPRLGEEIAAAVVLQPGATVPAESVLARARAALGANRAPRRVWFVESLPRTDGGKLRRRDLPAWVRYEPPDDSRATSRAHAASATEVALAALWANLLRVREVAADADFFMLGGDSLRGALLLEQVATVFGVRLPVGALFDRAANVARMAATIDAQRNAGAMPAPVATIPRRTIDAPIPLSDAQLRTWFLQRLQPRSVAYHEARLWRIDGALDIEALRAAIEAVVRRQTALRTRFVRSGAEPRQVIDADPSVELEIVALPCAADDEESVRVAAREHAARPMDLAAAPALRWVVFELGPQRYALLRIWHHMIADGLAGRILQKDLSDAYAAALAGDAPALPALPIEYADYAMWKAQRIDAELRAGALAYWKKRLADLSVLALPADFRRPPTQSFRGDVVTSRLAPDSCEALKALGRAHGASAFVTFLAAFSALLSRLADAEDLAIGTPVTMRPLPQFAEVIGDFANMLVCRIDVSRRPTSADLLARTRDCVRELLEHRDAPFAALVDALGVPRDPSRNPLFQVAFALRERDAVDLAFAGASVRRMEIGAQHAKFDLTLSLIDAAEGVEARWELCTDVFERATIVRIARQYETLVAAMAAAPDRPVATLPLMSDVTRAAILDAAIGSAGGAPIDSTIDRRFGEQVRAAPRAPAIDTLDYATLEARSNHLAVELRAQGVIARTVVAVARRQSADIAIAWLAVLKAGAAYLPIDPDMPRERVAFMLADAKVSHAVADQNLAALFAGCSVICPEAIAQRAASSSTDASPPDTGPDDAAYVIYTSGSTGKPKGVVIPHRAVLGLVCGTDCAQLGPADTVAQLANPAFDASTFEFWGALLNGARIAPIAKTTAIAPRALAAALAKERVTALFLTTALFNAVAREVPAAFAGCRYVLVGGEAVEPRWVAEVLRAGPPQHLLDGYGPTETTTFATWHEVRELAGNASTVPIGRPLANTDVFVLRPDFEPAAPGEPGEIFIGGPRLALGYLNATAELAARFAERAVANLAPRRLYRTGDRARLRDDGAIEFLGRTDGQIKLRGHRIELGEIEAAIERLPQVRAAAVTLEGDTTENRKLVAYVVRTDAGAPPPAGLWNALRPSLPEYMLPTSVVWLPSLPLNASGKVDRRALATIGAPEVRPRVHTPPRDMFEQVLVRIWETLLDVRPVGIFDRFFEIGGHSLLAARLVDEIERETGLAAPLTSLFVDDTIAGLARVLRDGAPDLAAPIVTIDREGSRPPFVFLHGDFTGGGFYSRALAHALGPDQPVLIAHPHGLVDTAIPETIEAMAADRINALRAARPHGPYIVGGHCNGAFVAFEMARQLIDQGERVPAIVMIEARAPRSDGFPGDIEANDSYVAFDPGGGVRLLAARDRQTDAELRYSRAMDRYVAPHCATHVVIVRSRKLEDERRDLGWSRLAESAEVHVLPGDHVTLITRHTLELAQVVRSAIDRALARAQA